MSRPNTLTGTTTRIRTGCGWLYVTVNTSDAYREVFLRLGKGGGCVGGWCEFVGRLITFAWNAGVPLGRVIHAGIGTQCPNPQHHEGKRVLSCPDAVARVLKECMELDAHLGVVQNEEHGTTEFTQSQDLPQHPTLVHAPGSHDDIGASNIIEPPCNDKAG